MELKHIHKVNQKYRGLIFIFLLNSSLCIVLLPQFTQPFALFLPPYFTFSSLFLFGISHFPPYIFSSCPSSFILFIVCSFICCSSQNVGIFNTGPLAHLKLPLIFLCQISSVSSTGSSTWSTLQKTYPSPLYPPHTILH